MHFLILYGVPEAREVSRKLPGARSSVVLEYEPKPPHGDPFHPQNYQFPTLPKRVRLHIFPCRSLVCTQDISCAHTRDLLCAHKRSLVCTQEISCVRTRDILCAHKRSTGENVESYTFWKCRKLIVLGVKWVAVGRFGLILKHNGATGSRKLSRYLPGLRDAI